MFPSLIYINHSKKYIFPSSIYIFPWEKYVFLWKIYVYGASIQTVQLNPWEALTNSFLSCFPILSFPSGARAPTRF